MAEGTFDDITERLDEIIAQVRSKDTSLERSLDLFDEAIELGPRAVDMVDEQEAAAAAAKSGDVASKSGDAASEVAGAAPESSAASGSAGAADANVVAAGGA